MRNAMGCGFAGFVFLAACAVADADSTRKAQGATDAYAPAGIVMELRGTTNPSLSLMAEIPANKPITLGAGCKLTFLQYARCKLVTVAGGVLWLTQANYKTDGYVEGEKDGPCPQIYSLTSPALGMPAATSSTMISHEEEPRKPGEPWKIEEPVNTQLALTGVRASKFQFATMFVDGHPDNPVTSFAITDGKLVASDKPMLMPYRRYILRLMPSHGARPSEFIFQAPSEMAPLVILRLD